MDELVRTHDSADHIVELFGLTLKYKDNPYGDIEIAVTGPYLGEKLLEELLIGNNTKQTQRPRIMKAHNDFLPCEYLQGGLNALELTMSANDVRELRGFL
jgi:FlaA1/EpsC-like NDP-sugar epimerase